MQSSISIQGNGTLEGGHWHKTLSRNQNIGGVRDGIKGLIVTCCRRGPRCNAHFGFLCLSMSLLTCRKEMLDECVFWQEQISLHLNKRWLHNFNFYLTDGNYFVDILFKERIWKQFCSWKKQLTCTYTYQKKIKDRNRLTNLKNFSAFYK